MSPFEKIALAVVAGATIVACVGLVLAYRLMRRIEREAAERRHRLFDRVDLGGRAPGNGRRFSLRPERTEHND
jgi:hypothetical protein